MKWYVKKLQFIRLNIFEVIYYIKVVVNNSQFDSKSKNQMLNQKLHLLL